MAGRVATAVRPFGPRAAIIDCPLATVIPLATALQSSGLFHEVVPAEQSVLVTWSATVTLDDLHGVLQTVDISGAAPVGRDIEIPTRYDGPDLEAVARTVGMSVADVVALHSGTTFLAAFAGFAPGFIYCTGLPPRLVVPRRDTPRLAVAKGAVAIADVYTAVYPSVSPGGWNLIGHTDVELFDLQSSEPALIRPGDRVRFVVRNS